MIVGDTYRAVRSGRGIFNAGMTAHTGDIINAEIYRNIYIARVTTNMIISANFLHSSAACKVINQRVR